MWEARSIGQANATALAQTAPTVRVASTPGSGSAYARVDVKLWDSEANASQVMLQYQNPPNSGSWLNATLLSIDGACFTAAGSATPQGATHQLVRNAVQDLGATFHASVLLRARAADFASVGAWSEPLYYPVDVTGDADGDGIPDGWEIANAPDPNSNDANADPDGDGASNVMEFSAGTNPHDPSSVFRVTGMTRNGSNLTLTWASVSGKTYVVQSAAMPGVRGPTCPEQL